MPRAKPPSATGSTATCAAAPAIRTSSRPCRPAPPRWARLEEHAMNAPTPGFIGRSVERKEDARFLTGRGQYTDDIVLPQQSYAYFLRSPYAHAKLLKVDTTAASKAPGVLGIFTGEHFKAVGGLPCGWLINS